MIQKIEMVKHVNTNTINYATSPKAMPVFKGQKVIDIFTPTAKYSLEDALRLIKESLINGQKIAPIPVDISQIDSYGRLQNSRLIVAQMDNGTIALRLGHSESNGSGGSISLVNGTKEELVFQVQQGIQGRNSAFLETIKSKIDNYSRAFNEEPTINGD